MGLDNKNTITLPEIIGLPPMGNINKNQILRSMPIAEIIPAHPDPKFGLTVFNLSDQMGAYKKILEKHGYNVKGDSLKLAFLADNFPTDSFANEYGEGILEKMTSAVSQGVASVQQMMGSQTVGETYDIFLEGMKGTGGVVGDAASAIDSARKKAVNSFKNMTKNANKDVKALGNKLGSIASSMAAGSRIDFPQLWKNSSFEPSYTMTVRLFNPNPANDKDTAKYIIGPIAAILLLGLPRTKDGNTYNWPFLHKITCKGIYFLNPCYISNISVIKGGDQQSIHWNQRLGMVDVRIDFGSLYSSILVGEKYESVDRPNLENYLNVLLDKRDEKPEKMKVEEVEQTINTGQSGDSVNLNDNSKSRNTDSEKSAAAVVNPGT